MGVDTALAALLWLTLTLAPALAAQPSAPPSVPPSVPPGAPPTASSADLDFMTGAWEERREGPRGLARFEEHWLPARGGLMLGLGRTTRGEGEAAKPLGFEFLRIEFRADGVVYVAQPGGKAPTEFRLTEWQAGSVLFENASHDHPQRIRYRVLPGGELEAQIEGPKGVQTWRFSRQR
jgi:Domain of unknown function (DUF6265)